MSEKGTGADVRFRPKADIRLHPTRTYMVVVSLLYASYTCTFRSRDPAA
jgi:hypothetical protein